MFDVTEMAELDAEKLSKGHGASLDTVRPAKKSKSKVECSVTIAAQDVEEASAASGQDRGARPQARPPGKRSTPAGPGKAESAPVPKANKRCKIPDVTISEGLFFDPSRALGVACAR